MPLNANALTDLATAKEYLEIPVANVTYDAQVERLINVASQRVERYVDRLLIQQTHVDRYDGRSQSAIILKQWPAQKPTEVNIDNDWTFDASTALDPDLYELVDDSVLQLKQTRIFARGRRNVRVTYLAGYLFAELPPDIVEACLMLVQYLYTHQNDQRIGKASQGKREENISFVQGMPLIVTELLDPYKRCDFAEGTSGITNA